VGNRGRAIIIDGAGELVDLTAEIHQIGATFTLPQIYYRALFVHHALHLFQGQRARRARGRERARRGLKFEEVSVLKETNTFKEMSDSLKSTLLKGGVRSTKIDTIKCLLVSLS
jgi:hypothetical protein